MPKKEFTKEEILSIIKEASDQGVRVTLANHNVYPSMFYKWKESLGIDSSLKTDVPFAFKKQMKKLENENNSLRTLIVEKELTIKMQSDLLQKKRILEKQKSLSTNIDPKA